MKRNHFGHGKRVHSRLAVPPQFAGDEVLTLREVAQKLGLSVRVVADSPPGTISYLTDGVVHCPPEKEAYYLSAIRRVVFGGQDA
jgi:hypothetical protein